MQKYTHLIFALLLFLLLNQILHFPIYLALFAFLGAMLPDFDLKVKKLHRKIFHNVFFLAIVLFVLLKLNLINQTIAIIFSIGFLSHILIDGFTVSGVYPFWPLKFVRIKGMFKTGKLSEHILFSILLIITLSLFVSLYINL